MVVMARWMLWTGLAATAVLWGCGEGDKANVADGPASGSGIVKKVTCKSAPGAMAEGQGVLTFEWKRGGQPLKDGLKIKLRGTGPQAAVVEKGDGARKFEVEPGVYAAEVDLTLSDAMKGDGKVTDLTVAKGVVTTCAAEVELDVGMVEFHFTNEGINVDDSTHLSFYKAGEDPTLNVPVLGKQPAGKELSLAPGNYDVHAEFGGGGTVLGDLWMKALEVKGGGAKTTDTKDFGVKLQGATVMATNYGKDVNKRTTVYFYRPGADMDYAVAVARGAAGKLVAVEPGTYDLRVVYKPSDNSDTWADKRMPAVAIGTTPENTHLSLTVDMDKPIATIQLKVLMGTEEVTDRAQVRLINAGADRGAASDVVDETGAKELVVPAGDYEMLVLYKGTSQVLQSTWQPLKLEQGAVIQKEIKLGGS